MGNDHLDAGCSAPHKHFGCGFEALPFEFAEIFSHRRLGHTKRTDQFGHPDTARGPNHVGDLGAASGDNNASTIVRRHAQHLVDGIAILTAIIDPAIVLLGDTRQGAVATQGTNQRGRARSE